MKTDSSDREKFDSTHLSSMGTYCVMPTKHTGKRFADAFVEMCMCLGDSRVEAVVRLYLWQSGLYGNRGVVEPYAKT